MHRLGTCIDRASSTIELWGPHQLDLEAKRLKGPKWIPEASHEGFQVRRARIQRSAARESSIKLRYQQQVENVIRPKSNRFAPLKSAKWLGEQ